MTKVHLLLCALLASCGDPNDDLLDETESALAAQADATTADAGTLEAPFESTLQRCYAEAPARERSREVHTVGRYLALGDTMLAVQVSIPKAPHLAGCIEQAVASSAPPGPPRPSNEMASGSFAIDLGGPRPPMKEGDFERQFDEHQRGMKALMRKVVQRGVLPADHYLVREVLAQP